MKRPTAQPVQNNMNNSRGGGFRPSIGIGGMGMGVNMGGRGGSGRSTPQRITNYMEPMYKPSITWKRFGIAFQ